MKSIIERIRFAEYVRIKNILKVIDEIEDKLNLEYGISCPVCHIVLHYQQKIIEKIGYVEQCKVMDILCPVDVIDRCKKFIKVRPLITAILQTSINKLCELMREIKEV